MVIWNLDSNFLGNKNLTSFFNGETCSILFVQKWRLYDSSMSGLFLAGEELRGENCEGKRKDKR